MNKILKSNFHVLLIIAFAFICYHFLWLNPSSMKWDLAEQYLPWRYFLGKSVQNGELPFWNPFQLGGYPAYADPQSATWYYPAWIIGSIAGYSMRIIELEVLLFIILAGTGFYFLLKKLGTTEISACLCSISYMCSGFIVGNAQHLTWIAAAAWIPWLFYHYIFIRKDIYNTHSATFILILYLFISSSYPAFAIVSAYILLIDQFLLLFKSERKLKFLFDRLMLLSACILILSPIIYSVMYSSDFFSRGDGVSLAKALQHPFSFQSLLSLIIPFASFKNFIFFKTDISMSNAYIGLLPIVIIISSIITGNIKKGYIWLLISMVFLIIGFGDLTPVRALLYNHLPGFNLFRFPALFRLFFIITILIYTAKQFDFLDFSTKKNKLIIVSMMLIFISFIGININSWHPFNISSLSNLSKEFDTTTFTQHIIYQVAIHVIVLILTFLFILKKLPTKYLLILWCFDLFLSVRLNSMATMVLDTKTKDVDAIIANAPLRFQTPSTTPLIGHIDQAYEYRWPLNWNMNCYFGEIAIDGYNPFILKTFNALSDSKLKDSIWMNSWFYVPTLVISSDTPLTINAGTAWINMNHRLAKQSLDSNTSAVKIDSIHFTASRFYCRYNADSSAKLVFAQNPYYGWRATIDKQETPITIVNFSQQMIELKPGKHSVEWVFEDKTLNIITYIHLVLMVILSIFVSIKNIRNLHI